MKTFNEKQVEGFQNVYILSLFSPLLLLFVELKLFPIPFFAFITSIFVYYLSTKIFLQKLGMEGFRDLINPEILREYPKTIRRFNISIVPIAGMCFSVGLALNFIIGFYSLFQTKSWIGWIIGGILFLFLFINSIKVRGIVIEAPTKIKKYANISYTLPLTKILLSFWRISIFVLIMGLVGIGIRVILFYIFGEWVYRSVGAVLWPFLFLVVLPLFFKLRNWFFCPILFWIKENVKCPNCRGKIERVNFGISEYSLFRIIITCENCQRRFNLESGFFGKRLYFYR